MVNVSKHNNISWYCAVGNHFHNKLYYTICVLQRYGKSTYIVRCTLYRYCMYVHYYNIYCIWIHKFLWQQFLSNKLFHVNRTSLSFERVDCSICVRRCLCLCAYCPSRQPPIHPPSQYQYSICVARTWV